MMPFKGDFAFDLAFLGKERHFVKSDDTHNLKLGRQP